MSDNTQKKGTKESGGIISIIICLIVLAAAIAIAVWGGVFSSIGYVFGSIQIAWQTILRLVIMIAVLVIISKIVLMILGKIKFKRARSNTLVNVFRSLIKYGVVLIGFCWGLSIVGVNVSTIFASVGVVALILGFGAESLVADLVTGVFILFENQYNVGDIIEVDGFRGTVKEIGIRTISLVDTGENIKIINNSDLKNIINRSNKGSVALCRIGVTYEADLEEIEAKFDDILKNINEKYPEIFTGPIKYVGVDELADSSVVLLFKAPVGEADIFNGKRILNRELKIAFDKEKIAIPYPQLDVHSK